MILSKLKYAKRNPEKILQHQRVNVKCDECEKEYNAQYTNNVLYGRKHYNGSDLCKGCRQVIQYQQGRRNSKIGEIAKQTQTGKSYEERFGEKRAKEIKSKLGKKGALSSNWGDKIGLGKMLGERNKLNKGKTLEEIYGIKKASKIRKKLSIATSGKNNPMYGKPSPIGSGNGWSGWFDGIYFRSLLELSYMVYLIENDIQFENGEKRKYAIEYTLNEKKHIYYSDFYLLESNELIEIKPSNLINTKVNLAKAKAARLKFNYKIVDETQIKQLSKNQMQLFKNEGRLKFVNRWEKRWNKR